MTFNDIFKDGFIESGSSISAVQIGLTLVVAFLIGVFIYQVYKKSYQSVVYTKSFSISLVMMTMITALVIMAVTANVVLSLGMVGALSIVRFRAAIKDPMDIVFMFFAIAAGIVVGASFYTLAVIGSFVIGLIIYGFSTMVEQNTPYLLIVQFTDNSVEDEVIFQVKKNTVKNILKSKIVTGEYIEVTYEVRVKDDAHSFVQSLNSIKSVEQAMLVSSMEYTA